MKVSANYQFDRIWNHLEDGPWGVAERGCLYNAKRGGGSPLTAGGTFPKWGTRTIESGERELSPNISSPCFLRNILKNLFFMDVLPTCISVHNVSAWYPCRPEKNIGPPETRIGSRCEPLPKPVSLKEHPGFLSTESSPSPLAAS